MTKRKKKRKMVTWWKAFDNYGYTGIAFSEDEVANILIKEVERCSSSTTGRLSVKKVREVVWK